VRILALLTDSFGGRGGIAQYNRDFVTALSLSSAVKEVVVLPRLGSATHEGLPAKVSQERALASRASYSLKAAGLALGRGPFDIVFCGHLYLAPLAMAIARTRGLPMWLQVHGIDAWERPSRLLQASLEQADLVTAVSRYTRQRILQWASIEPHRIRVLPNTMRFAIRERDRGAQLPGDLPFAGKPFLITVSRISRKDDYKGHRRVIAVLAGLRRRHPDLQYVIVGDGDDRSGLEAAAAEAGVAHCVSFLGHASTNLLQSLLAAASAFVMPSTGEGFGIVFLEAAAYGLPVVAGNKDGSVDALADGALGALVDPDDPAALSEALSKAIDGQMRAPDRRALERFEFANFLKHVDALVSALSSNCRPAHQTSAGITATGVA
jgi:phosphatidylinositol alpha-1,6-mannosyltransferase